MKANFVVTQPSREDQSEFYSFALLKSKQACPSNGRVSQSLQSRRLGSKWSSLWYFLSRLVHR